MSVLGEVPQKIVDRCKRNIMDRVVVTKRGCWEWTGPKNNMGYGVLYVFRQRRVLAHRASYEMFTGKTIPEGALACHCCDNPCCVNPDHIWPGTMKENVADAVAKGRLKPPQEYGAQPWNKLKTHCVRGHEMSGDNVVPRKNGGRLCRQCMRIREKNKRNRRNEKARAFEAARPDWRVG